MNTAAVIGMGNADFPELVRKYHQRTKHQFERYAASPGFLDWATQPDPFRSFSGSDRIALPLRADGQTALYAELFQPGRILPQPSSLDSIGVLLELSFGLSAWKAFGGDRWALRCNPSSGNLHPTEAYIVTGIPELDPGVYHYHSLDHVLERRCRASQPFSGLLVGFSSIHWREAWKYGERAFRYCQHDIGHALGALRYAAGVLGWRVQLVDDWSDENIAALLGLDRETDFDAAERETPDLLCVVGPDAEQPKDLHRLLQAVANGQWQGQANVLSRRHSHRWEVIDEVHRATSKPRTERAFAEPENVHPLLATPSEATAEEIIRRRRSAQAFDGITAISAQALWRMLDAALPRPDVPPFDVWPWPPRVHLLLFVHRVVGLAPGLYLFLRRDGIEAELRSSLRQEFTWQRPEPCPEHLRIYCLVRANCQRSARNLSCHQEIAAESAFSVGMLAEFDDTLKRGPWNYRRLFWESGLIGQALYLEAEAAGVRGTGIGCFFDDPVHELLGLTGTRFQSLYHFTVGAAVEDPRLQTLPPYGHLQR